MKRIMTLCILSSACLVSADYYAPYQGGTTKTVTQGYDGTVSHYGAGYAYALDFGGQFDVYAPSNGKVDYTGQDSTKISYCINNPQHWHGPANYVRIKHTDGLYSYYYHLKSINVKIGDDVIQGQTKIGISGNTGCSTNNHLHIQFATSSNMSKAASKKITFKDIGLPTQGKSYTSGNYYSKQPDMTITNLTSSSITSTGAKLSWTSSRATSQRYIASTDSSYINALTVSGSWDCNGIKSGEVCSTNNTGTSSSTNINLNANGKKVYWRVRVTNGGVTPDQISSVVSYTTPASIVLSSVGVTCSSTTLNAGQGSSCYAKAYYTNGTNKDITSTTSTSWSSSNSSVASVSSSGLVTAKTVNSTTSATIKATYSENGKNLYGSRSITVNKSIVADNKPTIKINTSGSSSSNNPKSSNFTLSVTSQDDIGLNKIAYMIYNTSSGSSTSISGTKSISGKSNTTSLNLSISNLVKGSYKVLVAVSDTKGQISDYKYYFFQKK